MRRLSRWRKCPRPWTMRWSRTRRMMRRRAEALRAVTDSRTSANEKREPSLPLLVGTDRCGTLPRTGLRQLRHERIVGRRRAERLGEVVEFPGLLTVHQGLLAYGQLVGGVRVLGIELVGAREQFRGGAQATIGLAVAAFQLEFIAVLQLRGGLAGEQARVGAVHRQT